ncbi:uncharacterized protein [Triticum aestivum]|uniref:uncharacterized protein isoform X3 n=1 Tax=Triticum aestivum TaxID=4565 RepID=UPI001D003F72|nr:uncharacterized protein LOC123162162 isoform X3 [Triticum aestivum]
MAAATPSKSNKDVMAFDYAKMLIPISPSAIRATLDYDISAICKILMANDGRSVAERMDYLSKNFASFKKPEALVPVDDLEDEDDEELMDDEKTSASYAELQVPSEGEQECKKIISKL